MSDDPKVVNIEPKERPLDELPEKERLGTQIKRLRLRAKCSVKALADSTNIPEELLESVERFDVPLDANQLQSLATALDVQWHPLLDLARDYHRAIWKQQNGGQQGVQLAEMDAQVGSVAGPLDKEAEAVLVKAADDLLFLSNVAREAADKALTSAMQVRAMLADRGVIPKDAPLELLDNPKVQCAACDVVLDRNREATVRFEPAEGGEPMYFGSRACGDRFLAGESFECERAGRFVNVQTSAQEEEIDGE